MKRKWPCGARQSGTQEPCLLRARLPDLVAKEKAKDEKRNYRARYAEAPHLPASFMRGLCRTTGVIVSSSVEQLTKVESRSVYRRGRLESYAVVVFLASGSSRILFPVAAKIALQTAGANGGTPGSPTPAGGASLSTM
jgi:hypothetical protein